MHKNKKTIIFTADKVEYTPFWASFAPHTGFHDVCYTPPNICKPPRKIRFNQESYKPTFT
ncbi:hypothetical protein HMPREF6745_0970 [Prevotella sp. oral taxon 472 str. F0295]|nr:hypothetical protein HMPREF6745_0970 [Prevotella sp. oral taxon 472 str. F0295]